MLSIIRNILQSISKFIKFLQEKIMPIFNVSKVGSVNSGSDVISKVYAGPDLMYSAGSKGYLFRDLDEATGTLSIATGELDDAASITSIGSGSMQYGFYNCTGLTGSVSFPNLTSIDGYGMWFCFFGCTGITSISFPKLETLYTGSMYQCFNGCTGLTGSVSFPNLTNVMSSLFNCFKDTGVTEVHFKSSLSGNEQCTADNLGITGTVYFDL